MEQRTLQVLIVENIVSERNEVAIVTSFCIYTFIKKKYVQNNSVLPISI